MSEEEAKKKALDKCGEGWDAKLLEERSTSYIFECETSLPDAIPSGLLVAVNKKTGKIGISLFSEDEAANNCK